MIAGLRDCWEGLLGRLTGGMARALDRVYLSATQRLRFKNVLEPKCGFYIRSFCLRSSLVPRFDRVLFIHKGLAPKYNVAQRPPSVDYTFEHSDP